MKHVVCIGPFPPPTHGMAKNLKIMADDLSENASVKCLDTSPGSLNKDLKYHIRKMKNIIQSLTKLLFFSTRDEVISVYIPIDSGFGAYYSYMFILISRIFNHQIYIHHRSFSYITKKKLGMKLISILDYENTTHIFLCEKMKLDYEIMYGVDKFRIVSNAMHVSKKINLKFIKKDLNNIVIGHMSNLCYEKGLKEIIEMCEIMIDKKMNFTIRIAGNVQSKDILDYINTNVKKYSGYLIYDGVINENNKYEFFEKCDFFIFPSYYHNEAQPNVIFEAQASGLVCITSNVACMTSDIDCNTGFVLVHDRHFSSQAVAIIEKLQLFPENFHELQRNIIKEIKMKSQGSMLSYNDLVYSISKGNV